MKNIESRSTKRKLTPGGLRFVWALAALALAGMPQTQAQASRANIAPIIDNERVSVRDITLTPGNPSPLERHDTDSVTMFLVGGKIRTTDAKGHSRVAMRKTGDAIFEPKGAEEKEEVISGSPARLIVVELKDHPVPPLPNNTGYPLAYPRPGSKKVLENSRVTVWNYTWKLGVPTPMHFHDKDVVIVFLHDGSVKSTTPKGESTVADDKAGVVRFTNRDRVHFEELVKGEESAITMELK